MIFHMSIPCEKTFPWVSFIFYSVTLTLEFDPFLENFNLPNNFWTVSARSFTFYMSIPCDKTFPWLPLLLPLTFEFELYFVNFNLPNSFWTVSARSLIFHMSKHCDKTFPKKQFFSPVTLTLEFDPFCLKTLTLLITFEQWVLELWYFTWAFLVIRLFCSTGNK